MFLVAVDDSAVRRTAFGFYSLRGGPPKDVVVDNVTKKVSQSRLERR